LRIGGVQVLDGLLADFSEVAVDPADEAVDVVAEPAVFFEPLTRGCRDLHKHRFGYVHIPIGYELAEGAQSLPQALGVIQAVDAQQHPARIAQAGANLGGPPPDGLAASQFLETGGIDRNRIRFSPNDATVIEVYGVSVSLVSDALADLPHEVLCGCRQLDTDHIGAP